MDIREAEETDLPQLIKLMEQLGYSVTLEKLSENFREYKRITYSIYVAESGGDIVGCIAWHILPFFHSDQKALRIISLVVDEKKRGKGVGKALVDWAEDTAKKEHLSLVEVICSHRRQERDGIHDFYRKLGFSDNTHGYFRKMIGL